MNEIEMLENQKVACYYSPWKYFINEMAVNDMVYLYSNGKGIIARGLATGIVEIGGDQGDEHYMHLNRFEKLAIPLPASKTTELARSVTDSEYSIKWFQTMNRMPEFIGLPIWQYITRNNT